MPSMFAQCTSLTQVEIPEGPQTVGATAFTGCTSLRTIRLPSTVREIGHGAFMGCDSLTDIDLSPHIETIWGSAFAKCRSLTSLGLPDGLREMHDAFLECPRLREVTYRGRTYALPALLHTIPAQAQDFVFRMILGLPWDDRYPIGTLVPAFAVLFLMGMDAPVFLAAVQKHRFKLLRWLLKTDDAADLRVLLDRLPFTRRDLYNGVYAASEAGAKECYILLLNEIREGGELAKKDLRI